MKLRADYQKTANLRNMINSIKIIAYLVLVSAIALANPSPQDSLAAREWAQQMFGNAAISAELPEFNDSYGVVFRDLNNDQLADIYAVRFRDLNRLFINNGNGKFSDFTIASGLGGDLMSVGKQNLELGASAVDFDNNGWQDVLIIGWNSTTTLFPQRDQLNFSDHILANQFPPIDGNAGVWADIDRDGDLDLFITDEHHPNHLLINDGYGNFTEKAADFGLDLAAVSQGAAFADVDGDDFPDLYVCNWFAPDALYRNVNGTRFERVSLPILHLLESLNSNGVCFGDIDNDGDADMLVTDRQGSTALYENATVAPGSAFLFKENNTLRNPFPGYGIVIADLNNDGWQDIFLTNIGPNRLFVNDHGKFWLAFEESAPAAQRYYSTGAAVADVDADGDLDLFVANKDTSSMLFVNPVGGKNALRISLEGVRSNRDAIGAKIRLFDAADTTERTLAYREIGGGGGYLSIGESPQHFGVDPQKTYSATIRFPSGQTEKLDNLTAGQSVQLAEQKGIRKQFTRTLNGISRLVRHSFFWVNVLLFLVWLGSIAGILLLFTRRYRWQNTQTALFLVGMMALGYLLFLLLDSTPTHQVLLWQILALLVVGLVLGAFQEKIFRLERRRFGYRKLLESFSQELIFIKHNNELFEKLTAAIQQSMNVQYCALLEFVPEKNTAEIRAAAGDWSSSGFSVALPEHLRKTIAEAPVLEAGNLPKVLPEVATVAAKLVVPITRQEQFFALMLLGARHDGQPLAGEDFGMLQILARQAAIAIENNRYIEESQQLIQKLTESEIREQYISELENKNESLEKLFRELQETQSQLVQSEKMAGLGQLVAGVAHELNNPISFVYANMKSLQGYIYAIRELLTVLKHAPENAEKLRENLLDLDKKHDWQFLREDIDNLISESLEGSRRVKAVVENLRNFSRLDESDWKAVDLHEGLDSTLMLINNELKNRIDVRKNYGKLPPVLCNPGQINQVFMNVLVNAAQAISEKGEIRIATRSVGDGVEIEICDSGSGIPADVLPRIFDPFFTTKPVGSGTGLGLSVSYGIIRKHNGEIKVSSEQGKGTCFTIVLPIAQSVKK